MTYLETLFERFVRKWAKPAESGPCVEEDVSQIEEAHGITLPRSYRQFLLTYGQVYTPGLLDAVMAAKRGLGVRQLRSIM